MSATSAPPSGRGAEAPSASLAAAGRATIILTGGAVIVQAIEFIRQVYLAAEVGIDSGLDRPADLPGIATRTRERARRRHQRGARAGLHPGQGGARHPPREAPGGHRPRLGRPSGARSFPWCCGSVRMPSWPSRRRASPRSGTADEATQYLRAFAPLTLISSLTALLHATCQAERMFRAMVFSSVAGPALALTFMVVFWDNLGLEGLVAGDHPGRGPRVITILVAATLLRHVAPVPRLLSRGLGLGSWRATPRP